jgi:hypothetical protein
VAARPPGAFLQLAESNRAPPRAEASAEAAFLEVARQGVVTVVRLELVEQKERIEALITTIDSSA